MDDLKVNVVAMLDQAKTQRSINASLKKMKIDPITVKIKIDDKSMQQALGQIQKSVQLSSSQQGNKSPSVSLSNIFGSSSEFALPSLEAA
ncbi:hypothetical protein [Gehongia tenuis]|uniref:Uncharacterized protein n=1 Tax=Gehongia tenuis TaxID=2763655 RepID=A0A926D5D6_9FIRM|nr:hypothetical protein [Gehongia tenuis]MBC8531931.1 hypothetical protein [Gehongia tenuis]